MVENGWTKMAEAFSVMLTALEEIAEETHPMNTPDIPNINYIAMMALSVGQDVLRGQYRKETA